MAETMTVRLPDGTLVKNVPVGTTQEELVKLYSDSLSSQEEGKAATRRLTSSLESGLGATKLSKGRSLLERAGGAAPEVIGTTVGGILGLGAGGPMGAGLGGLLGGGAGESIRQLLATSGVAPRTFGTMESAQPERIRNAAAFGAATELGGAAAGKTLPGLFKRKLSPIQQRDIRLLEREDIPYTAGDIRPSGAAQQAENLLRGTLLGSKPATAFEQAQRESVVRFQERVLDKFGPMMTKEEVGEALQTAVQGRHRELTGPGGIFERAYRRVGAIFPAKVDTASIRRDVAPIKAELDKLTAEGRIGALAKSKENPSRFIDLVDRMSRFGLDAEGKAVPLTYQDVWRDKQSLDALIRSMSPDDPLRTRAKGTLKQLHGILDGAMEDAAKKVSPQAAERVRNINKAYGETKRLFEIDSPVSKIGDLNPETIVQRFFQPGATTPPKELLKALKSNPEIIPPLRRRVAENLLEGLGKEVEGVRITPAGQLREKVLKSRKTMEILFTKDQMGALDEFIQASSRAQASGRMMNPASGRQLLAMSQLVASGTLVVQPSIEGAAVVIGPEILSRALFNPKIARLLAKGFELKPGTAEGAKWAVRTMNALRSIESQPEED